MCSSDLFAPKAVEGFLLGYDSNTRAYRVFNKSSSLAEVSSDVVFDETNGSPREQVDLDDIDEDEIPTAVTPQCHLGFLSKCQTKNHHFMWTKLSMNTKLT